MSRLILNQIATPSPNPAAGKGYLFYSSTSVPAALMFLDENGNLCRLGGLTTKDYRLVKVTSLLNGTTTYTPTSGTQATFVEVIAGGGAGGGAASSTGGTNNSVGGGGGGGGYAMVWSTANVVGAHTVAIGAGGTVGTAGNNVGGTGGNSTYADTAAAVIAQGNGGVGGGGGGASATALGGRGAGGAGGTGPTGDRGIQGEDGDWGVAFSIVAATGMLSGKGGKSGLGFGGGGASVQTSGAGAAGRVYGGGGSGGADAATTNRQGGAGANGLIRVWEYA